MSETAAGDHADHLAPAGNGLSPMKEHRTVSIQGEQTELPGRPPDFKLFVGNGSAEIYIEKSSFMFGFSMINKRSDFGSNKWFPINVTIHCLFGLQKYSPALRIIGGLCQTRGRKGRPEDLDRITVGSLRVLSG
jgi:hypothetical protein